MWFVQWKSKAGTEWITLYISKTGYSKGTAELIMQKYQKKHPSWEFKLIYKD